MFGGKKGMNDYKKLAEARGLQFVGNVPKTTKHKTEWKCSCEETFLTTYAYVRADNIVSCKKCSSERRVKDSRKTKEDYTNAGIDRNIIFLGKKVPKRNNEKTKWGCNICNYTWETTYSSIATDGTGCPKCSGKARKTKDDYISLANGINYKFIGHMPSNVFGNTKWKCNKGHVWKTNYHLIDGGRRCPKCKGNLSQGVLKIKNILSENNIAYTTEKTFPDCRDKGSLRFDFYISENNLLIEFHGEQHYKRSNGWFGGSEGLKSQQRRDKIKSDWAAANGITLLVIPYTEFDRIEQILSAYL